jgi:hypothetical protein
MKVWKKHPQYNVYTYTTKYKGLHLTITPTPFGFGVTRWYQSSSRCLGNRFPNRTQALAFAKKAIDQAVVMAQFYEDRGQRMDVLDIV